MRFLLPSTESSMKYEPTENCTQFSVNKNFFYFINTQEAGKKKK